MSTVPATAFFPVRCFLTNIRTQEHGFKEINGQHSNIENSNVQKIVNIFEHSIMSVQRLSAPVACDEIICIYLKSLKLIVVRFVP